MNDPSFDELASAHLDGATTPEEAALVAADPALVARVEELRQVREAVAALPPVDAARREAAIATALAAFGESHASMERAPITPLAAGAARRRTPRRAMQVIGAAAVAALVLLAPMLGRMGSSSDDEATSFDSTGDAIEGGPDVAPDDDGTEALADGSREAGTTTTTPADAHLGAFDDLDALVAALSESALLPLEARDAQALATLDGNDCLARSATEQPATAFRSGATARVADEPVVVIVQTEAGVRTLLVYRVADCTLIAERPL